jgi:hypothetical protein
MESLAEGKEVGDNRVKGRNGGLGEGVAVKKVPIGWLTSALVLMAALGVGLGQPSARAQVGLATTGPMAQAGKPVVVLEYTAPTSATWGPTAGAPPTFAFGKPAQVLLVVPGGYLVRQEVPLEEAIGHATYVSQTIGHPIAVTIPDPAGGPARVEYVGTSRSDR